ncbi:uncharacterized protein LOC143357352 [Halictus rubicundus]|uniref:uncharacterized protein LOC143357352 n=1 Tax=Halictus rubicundus TaxID=77578 RepID=UPI0040370EC9
MTTPAQLTQDELLHALLQGRVDSYRQPKVPDFFKEDPALWFAQVESSLSAARITNQKTMADVVVAALKYDVVTTVKDILFMSPPPEDLYDRIKARIISSYAVSAESKLRQLLKGEVLKQLPSHVRAVLAMANVSEPRKLAELADKVVEASGTGTSAIAAVSSRDASLRALEEKRKIKQLLEHEERGDRTPSQFLRHIRSLAGNEVPEDFIRTLWMSRLPVAMQSVLATQDGVELEKVAALADRISEVTPAQIHPAAAANNVAALGDINALVEQIAALVTTKLEGRGRQPRSSTPSSRYRRRSRSKSKAESRPSGICWYHGRFGDKATKCTKPCTFQSGNDLQSR